MFRVTQAHLDRLIKYWKPKLGLEKWTIYAYVYGSGPLEGCHGDSDVEAEARRMVIRIRADQDSLLDFHDTVVHEMCHAVWWWTNKKGVKQVLEEQAFRDIMRCLAELSVKELEKEKP